MQWVKEVGKGIRDNAAYEIVRLIALAVGLPIAYAAWKLIKEQPLHLGILIAFVGIGTFFLILALVKLGKKGHELSPITVVPPRGSQNASPSVSPPEADLKSHENTSPAIGGDVPVTAPPSVSSPTPGKSSVNENNAESLTPEHIFTAFEQATTSSQRDSVRKLYLGVSVEGWKLRYNSVKTSDGKNLNVTFELDDHSPKSTFGIVNVSVPLKGNEFLRTAKKGYRFIVSGDISEVTALYIGLEKGSLRRTTEN